MNISNQNHLKFYIPIFKAVKNVPISILKNFTTYYYYFRILLFRAFECCVIRILFSNNECLVRDLLHFYLNVQKTEWKMFKQEIEPRTLVIALQVFYHFNYECHCRDRDLSLTYVHKVVTIRCNQFYETQTYPASVNTDMVLNYSAINIQQ